MPTRRCQTDHRIFFAFKLFAGLLALGAGVNEFAVAQTCRSRDNLQQAMDGSVSNTKTATEAGHGEWNHRRRCN